MTATALRPVPDRPAVLPVEYDRALQALAACTKVDEARTWDNKADALAAWAKIYRSDQASLLAQRLKLHAYRRMGQLAEELTPKFPNQPGPRALLLSEGLSMSQASAARCLARMPPRRFERVLSAPASPVTIAQRQSNRRPTWKRFGRATSMMVTFLEECHVEQLAEGIRDCGDKALVDARSRVKFLIDQLGELQRLLAKERRE